MRKRRGPDRRLRVRGVIGFAFGGALITAVVLEAPFLRSLVRPDSVVGVVTYGAFAGIVAGIFLWRGYWPTFACAVGFASMAFAAPVLLVAAQAWTGDETVLGILVWYWFGQVFTFLILGAAFTAVVRHSPRFLYLFAACGVVSGLILAIPMLPGVRLSWSAHEAWIAAGLILPLAAAGYAAAAWLDVRPM